MISPINALLIAGTDTEVGKTVLTSGLIAYWQRHRPDSSLGLLKPIQSGQGDRELYQRLFFPDRSLEQITPQFFEAPLAPPLAAAKAGAQVDLAAAWQALSVQCQQHDWVLVEGLGGLGSPVAEEWTVADLAAAWHLPVVLVVPVRLGAIAQAVANVALARQHHLSLRGIVLNCTVSRNPEEIAQWTPADLITRLTQIPVLGVLPRLENPEDPEALAAAVATLDLDLLWGQTPSSLTPA